MSFANNSESLNNSFLFKTTKKGTTTAKSVLEKLKTLGSSKTNNASIGIEEITDTISNNSPQFSNYVPTEAPNPIWTIARYSLIIIVGGFVILNILAALNLLSPNLEKVFKPFLSFLGHTFKKTIKPTTTINNSRAPSSSAPSNSAPSNSAPPSSSASSNSTPPNTTIQHTEPNNNKSDVNNVFNTSTDTPSVPQPDDAGSSTQASQSSSKSGYCYIGEDRGFRSCIKVGVNDTCMSGDIFPTQEICINPNLRQ